MTDLRIIYLILPIDVSDNSPCLRVARRSQNQDTRTHWHPGPFLQYTPATFSRRVLAMRGVGDFWNFLFEPTMPPQRQVPSTEHDEQLEEHLSDWVGANRNKPPFPLTKDGLRTGQAECTHESQFESRYKVLKR